MWLFDSQNLSCFGLRQIAAPDEPVDLERELCFQKLLLWMGNTEIGEDIAGDRDPLRTGREADSVIIEFDPPRRDGAE